MAKCNICQAPVSGIDYPNIIMKSYCSKACMDKDK